MATGISKSPRKSNENSANSPSGEVLGFQVTYAGKQDCSVILRTPPAALTTLWPSPDAIGASTNRLYYGDNLAILASLLPDPTICGRVRLVYIDPPYATGSTFESRTQDAAYEDLLGGAAYIEFLRARLILLRELLADDGSIYVHLDTNMAMPIKLIMDEIFGPKNFRNWITRKKCNPKNYTRRAYGNVSDFILFYTKTDNYVWHRPVEAWTPERAAQEYPYVDEQGRRYKKVPLHAPGVRNGQTGQPWRGMPPPPGKHWQYPPAHLDKLDAQGDIYWSPTGNPRRKIYLDMSAGIPVQDIWLSFRDAHNQNSLITGYPTEKNADLVYQIIEASSNPGDLVLDCFSGSGTTLAVADQLDRRWIGVDSSPHAIATTLRRFVHGLRPMGDFVTRRDGGPTAASLLPEPDAAMNEADGSSAVQTASLANFVLLAEQSFAPQDTMDDAASLLDVAELLDGKKTSRQPHKPLPVLTSLSASTNRRQNAQLPLPWGDETTSTLPE